MANENVSTELVRQTIMGMRPKDGVVTIRMVADVIGAITQKQKDDLTHRIHSMKSLGELERVGLGAYRVIPKTHRKQGVADRVWSVMRSRRVFSADDLMELADAGYGVVKHMIWKLKRNGYIRRVPTAPGKKREKAKYQLIKNVVERPTFDWKGNEVKHGKK